MRRCILARLNSYRTLLIIVDTAPSLACSDWHVQVPCFGNLTYCSVSLPPEGSFWDLAWYDYAFTYHLPLSSSSLYDGNTMQQSFLKFFLFYSSSFFFSGVIPTFAIVKSSNLVCCWQLLLILLSCLLSLTCFDAIFLSWVDERGSGFSNMANFPFWNPSSFGLQIDVGA